MWINIDLVEWDSRWHVTVREKVPGGKYTKDAWRHSEDVPPPSDVGRLDDCLERVVQVLEELIGRLR